MARQTKKQTNKAQRKRLFLRLQTLLIVLTMLVGAGILAYPTVAKYWNRKTQTRSIMTYTAAVSETDPEVNRKWMEKALEYNRKLAEHPLPWTLSDEQSAEYYEQLDSMGNGIMGYIKIEKIDVELPIYHGTSNIVLNRAIGHLEATSLPVGAYSYDETSGEPVAPDGSHCGLSGHTGLTSGGDLFTYLYKLTEGDIFTITVLDETFTYKVDHIETVLPKEYEKLAIVPGKDYCTLITCTPYGVNSHRLLVRGVRINTEQKNRDYNNIAANAIQIRAVIVAPVLALPILPILFTLAMLAPPRRRKDPEDILNEIDQGMT